ncbi:Methyl-accepting chemotaxis protein [Thermosyntropha lipolytica DSM 11003]|uniref:Methyl-accepting chemotaxis protein n=1 Tax=Thermosyntropha lipolytica DSM 11003 TaxID=1123382 RepID=A0A1M5JHX1_9FIRM|nr:methyl-accepting chemotaxis protein [Thermosyntropha lipolytica]SHG39859.1 Methyl-accepting chemotaxis protein [Thermosyntropha lipolytica DSM 11003]
MDNQLLKQNMIANHYRVLQVIIMTGILISAGTIAVFLAGKASSTITPKVIYFYLANYIFFTLLVWALIKKYPEKNWLKWIAIIIQFYLLMTCRVLSPVTETVNLMYLVLMLALLYFDVRLVIFAGLLVIAGDMFLMKAMPDIAPPANQLAIRYVAFILGTAAAFIGARAAQNLLLLACDREEKACSYNNLLKQEAENINTSSQELAESSHTLFQAAEFSKESFTQISQGIEDIAATSSAQAMQMEKTSQTINQMVKALQDIGREIERISELSHNFVEIVSAGRATIENQSQTLSRTAEISKEATLAVQALNKQSEEIGKIVLTISNIADQTSLLALNAAIEAARAGEAGRGFAVVAEEVRKLADESAAAAGNIQEIIREVQVNTAHTAAKIEESNRALSEQIAAVNEGHHLFNQIDKHSSIIDSSVHNISATVEELIASSDEIDQNIQNIATGAQQLAAAVEEVTAITSEQLKVVEEIFNAVQNINQMAEKLKKDADKLQNL